MSLFTVAIPKKGRTETAAMLPFSSKTQLRPHFIAFLTHIQTQNALIHGFADAI